MKTRWMVLAILAALTVGVLALAGVAGAQSTGSGGNETPPGGGGNAGPPRVARIAPANNAVGVDRDGNVTARFSERMRAATINRRTVRVFRGDFTRAQLNGGGGTGPALPGPVSYDAATRTATYDPPERLVPREDYTVVVEGANDTDGRTVRDRGGTAMRTDRIWHFRTGRR